MKRNTNCQLIRREFLVAALAAQSPRTIEFERGSSFTSSEGIPLPLFRQFVNQCYLPEFVAGPDIVDLQYAGPGLFRNYFRFGTMATFWRERRRLASQVTELLRATVPTLSGKIGQVIDQFFGCRIVNSNEPSMAIVLPFNLATTHRFTNQGFQVTTETLSCQSASLRSCPTFSLEFGTGPSATDFVVNFRDLPFRKPDGRNQVQWVTRAIRRYFCDGRRCHRPALLACQLGQAGNEDFPLIRQGRYYPGTEGLRQSQADGSPWFTRISVVVLVRCATFSKQIEPSLQQLSVAIHPDGQVTDLNCIEREWSDLVRHYAGLEECLIQSIVTHANKPISKKQSKHRDHSG